MTTMSTRGDPGGALLARLGLEVGDAGVLLGALLGGAHQADGEGEGERARREADAALAHLEAPWAERCQGALEQLRGLPQAQRAVVLRALSSALLAPAPLPSVSDEALRQELPRHHPQVQAAIVGSLPAVQRRRLSDIAPQEPCRLPSPLRLRAAQEILETLAARART